MSINRRAFYVSLSASAWRALAEPLPGLAFIGTLTRGKTVAALAVDTEGRYFAVTGRAVAALPSRKVLAALALAKASGTHSA